MGRCSSDKTRTCSQGFVAFSFSSLLNCFSSISTGEIKQILETELAVPVSKMQLKGWKSGDVSDSVSQLTVLKKKDKAILGYTHKHTHVK